MMTSGDEVARHGFRAAIVFSDFDVVEPACRADAILGDGELLLQLEKVALTVECRVSLAECNDGLRRGGKF